MRASEQRRHSSSLSDFGWRVCETACVVHNPPIPGRSNHDELAHRLKTCSYTSESSTRPPKPDRPLTHCAATLAASPRIIDG